MKLIRIIKANNETLPEDVQDALNYVLDKKHTGNYELYINGYDLSVKNIDTDKTYHVELDINYTTHKESEPAAQDWNPTSYNIVEVESINIISIDNYKVNQPIESYTETFTLIAEEFKEQFD